MLGWWWAGQSGDFVRPGAAPATGHITSDGKLAVHFTASVPNEQGYAEVCGVSGTGHGSNPHSADFMEECLGDPVLPGQAGYVAGRKTFHFGCGGPGWTASGTVSVQ
jgi:hypothetical protein